MASLLGHFKPGFEVSELLESVWAGKSEVARRAKKY